jgi:GNAT superfamily N-acetyltransferase
MIFQREILTIKLLEEIFPLLQMHYKEIAHYKDIKLEPDYVLYVKIEEAGGIRFYSYRDPEGKILGYAVFFIKTNMHYASSLQALQDVIFIHPEHRGHGKKFIAWCDEQLKSEGIQVVYHHVKKAHNFGPMLERMGYELVDLIYARRVN